jgi:hypothetical protein
MGIEGNRMDSVKSQAIGFGIAMALIVDVASHSLGFGILAGVLFAAGFYAVRRRHRPN